MDRPINGGERDAPATERTALLRTASAATPEASESLAEQHARQSPHAESVSRVQGAGMALALGLLIFLQTSNISLLTTIQSPIADALDAHDSVSWFASAYLIGMSSITPLAGRLFQIFRPQSYILCSSVLFAAGLAATAAAPSLPWFLFGRALAGIGAASNLPVAIMVIVDLTSVKRRGLFMGMLNTCFTIGVAFGAVVAGALEPAVGWRLVFAVQIPLALVGGIALFFAMPRFETAKSEAGLESMRHKLAHVDYLGVVTLMCFIVLLLLGFASPSGIDFGPVALSLVFFVMFIVVESRYASSPVIPVKLLRSRPLLTMCFATLFFMMSRWTVLFFSPQYATAVRSWSPARAGTILFAANGGFASGGLLAGWLHIRRAGSFYWSCIAASFCFAATFFVLGRSCDPSLPATWFIVTAFVNGLATGASLNYTLVHMLHTTDPSTHFVATSLVATFRGFAGSFASSLGAGLFGRVLKQDLEEAFARNGILGKDDLIRKLVGSPRLVASLVGLERQLAVESYADALKTLFFTAGILALIATALQAGTGWTAFDESKASVGQEPTEDVQVEAERVAP